MLTNNRQRGAPQILQQHPVARDRIFFFLFLADAKRQRSQQQVNKQVQITMLQDSANASAFCNLVSLPVQLGSKECGFGELGEVQLLLRRKQQLNLL